jgi:GH24 family phage-related lysozyme (muramidase)
MTAAEFIARFEGFRPKAYWDVNHWRVGYGSDTEGPEQAVVTRHTKTTKARALQNLATRIHRYDAVVIQQIGPKRWGALTNSQRTALTDLVYNYGHLPDNVSPAMSPNKTAAAIRALGGENGGVNRARRNREADLYLQGTK